MSTGMFAANGAVRKCSSIACAPASRSRKLSGPIASINDRPIADHIEYRPPTQSQNANMFAVSMPNSETFSAFVDTATKCLATAASSSPNASSSHARAARAFVSVSRVVNVFDEMMNSVSAASRPRNASTRSAPSTFETNRNCISARLYGAQRVIGHRGPEVAAADADVHDVADRPTGVTDAGFRRGSNRRTPTSVAARLAPRRRGRPRRRRARVPGGMRSATCNTDRSSVTLMWSPRNMASIRARRPRASTSSRSNRNVSASTRCLA